MISLHFHLSRRASIRILLFLTIVLAIPAGLQSGYAREAALQQTKSEHTASHGSSQSLPPTQTPASRISKPVAPSVCSPIGFSNNSYAVGIGPTSVEVSDFDSDGKLDLATTNFHSDNVSVLLGSGNGSFLSSSNYPAGYSPSSIAVADFFGDRIDDLVVGTGTNDVSYLSGEGDGTFFTPYAFAMGAEPYSVAASDVNNDGWTDLVTASGSSNNVSVRLNDGSGDLAPATHIAVSGAPYSLAIGDFNNDTKPDLATANNQANSVSVLLGNGNGTFQAPINFGVGSEPFAVAIGDFNGDSKQDVVATNRGSNSVSVLLGNGDGLFQPAIYFATGLEPFDVAVGDFNGDGKPDLASANGTSNNISVLLGNGDGSFQPPVNFSAGSGPNSVTIGDFNRDGKPDLASANIISNNVSVLLNTCVSVANTPTTTPVPTNTRTPLPTQTPGGATATPQACTIQFADVQPGSTFYPFVRCMACRGIISGYPCGGPGEPCNTPNDPYFRAGSPVTRGQLAKIVSNSAGFSDPPAGQIFQDVPPSSTFYPFAERLASRGVMGGYNCGTTPGEPCGPASLPYFRPGSGATRGQLTKIVANAAGFTDPAPGTFTFTDVPVGSTFHVYVERLLLNRPGVMGGYICGGVGEPCDTESRPYFRPSNPLSRGQTSKIVSNTFYPNCQIPAGAGRK